MKRLQKITRPVAALLIICCTLLIAGCDDTRLGDLEALESAGFVPETIAAGEYAVAAAVVYDGGYDDGTWQDVYGYLLQSSLVNLQAGTVDVAGSLDFDGLDIIYVAGSVALSENSAAAAGAIVAFAEAGGAVVLDNSLYALFDKSFIGASDYIRVTACPEGLDFPDLGNDLGEIQEIISDFASLYGSFSDYGALAERDYGYAVICDSAVAMARWEGCGLYTVNKYGDGFVFFTNPILPNFFSISGYDMLAKSDDELPFSDTAAGCNQLLISAFAGFASKQAHGYYIGRVFGSFGSPGMAWELHYEEITGIANNSMEVFSELCMEYLQVPSFTLIRNSYRWFLRTESVTYYLNESSGGELSFSLDLYENAYSSGTHVASAGEWLSLESIENGGSYFEDYPEFTYRAYPEVLDYNGDGVADIFCGSADGKLYYYAGETFDNRLCVSGAQVLTDADGDAISVSSYSAPAIADINGDGHLDLISGSGDGNIYWFSGNGSLTFEPQGVLLDTDISGQTLPAVGDLNGDGVTDLAVGSNESILLVFYGTGLEGGAVRFSHSFMDGLSRRCANAGLGTWLAPEIYDINSDGTSDLAVGTADGYVAMFETDRGGNPGFVGYIETGEMNYKGNYRIKTGNNCVPVFYDIDGDGADDLVCGTLEYGLAYPIDSEYFPYARQLRQQAQYAQENEFYLGVHFYTGAYASPGREADELGAHIEAFESYGVGAAGLGANQHTWFLSAQSGTQSLLSAWNAGLLWNSGFSPVNSTVRSPHTSAENVITLPFYLTSGGERTILVQNCSVLPYVGSEWTDITGKYGVPVCIYYHCDFVYASDAEARSYLERVSDFWWQYGYNFVGEDQLMAATAAAFNLTVDSRGDITDGGVTLTPGEISGNAPLYDPAYQSSAGAKIVFGEWIDTGTVSVDADVWRLDGSTLYLGLNRKVTVTLDDGTDTGHIERVNVPAEITATVGGADIAFLDGGMMQVVVSCAAHTPTDGWTVTEADGRTVFTKYGSADRLEIIFDS